jgi:hypothetical protein
MPEFHHRKNPDGSWISICLACYLTVIFVSGACTEADLEPQEARHECDKSRHDEDLAQRRLT